MSMWSAHLCILLQLLLDPFFFSSSLCPHFLTKPTASHLCCLDALGYGAIYLARATPLKKTDSCLSDDQFLAKAGSLCPLTSSMLGLFSSALCRYHILPQSFWTHVQLPCCALKAFFPCSCPPPLVLRSLLSPLPRDFSLLGEGSGRCPI